MPLMRLLNVFTLIVHEFPKVPPSYAIASHTWTKAETTFQKFRDGIDKDSAGYKKILGFAAFVKDRLPGIEWLWLDTCCINRESAQEVSAAVMSMFQWYERAEVCVVHLDDVHAPRNIPEIMDSKWFRRGWTLQELLAPRMLVMVTSEWKYINCIGKFSQSDTGAFLPDGPRFSVSDISAVTGIPVAVLNKSQGLESYTAQQKLQWASGRETLLPEDRVYAMMGILGVSISPNYGEGFDSARTRLRNPMKQQKEESQKKPDPWLGELRWKEQIEGIMLHCLLELGFDDFADAEKKLIPWATEMHMSLRSFCEEVGVVDTTRPFFPWYAQWTMAGFMLKALLISLAADIEACHTAVLQNKTPEDLEIIDDPFLVVEQEIIRLIHFIQPISFRIQSIEQRARMLWL